MKFSDRLKDIRESKNLTQEELANLSGVSARSIQRYESGASRPRVEATEKIAKALNVSVNEILGSDDMLIAQAGEKYGARGAKQAQELMNEITGLFAGGEMAEEDMDIMLKAIQDAYWLAKDKNKKYTPKKHADSTNNK